MEINKAYKFRIYPTKSQIKYIEDCFIACRYVYNEMLATERDLYSLVKQFPPLEGQKPNPLYKPSNLSKIGLSYKLVEFKEWKSKWENNNWLYQFDAHALAYEMENLAGAYNKFFKKQGGFPKFKKKTDSYQSFRTRQKIKVTKDGIKIPKLKPIETVFHREVEGKPKQMTISRENDKYYVSIMVELDIKLPPKSKIIKEVGVDLGIHTFATFDDGTKIENPKFLKEKQEHMAKLQQKLALAKVGGKNYEKLKKKIRNLHEEIKNKRTDFLHNTSTNIIKNNDRVYTENLNVKGMTASAKGTAEEHGKNVAQKAGLNRNILDSGFSTFVSMLDYKAKFNGKELVKVSRFFPSSKKCSTPNCNYIKEDLTLDIREWICPVCNTKHDRDVNSAINMKAEGRRSLNKKIK